MRELTLEKEFNDYCKAHMFAILKVKMTRYYEVILANSVQLPPFMGGDTAKSLAQKDVEELYNRDKIKFYEMYEKAYQEIAKETDF